MSQETLAGRIVDRVPMQFFQHVTVGGVRELAEFEKDIVWLARSEATWAYMHGGHVLKEGSTYNDFYGYLTSVTHSIADLPSLAEKYSITTESSLSLELRAKVFLRAYQENDECAEWNATATERKMKFKFLTVPSDYCVPHIVGDDNDRKSYQSLSSLEVTRDLVWTSQNTDDANSTLSGDFVSLWCDNQQQFEKVLANELNRIQTAITTEV